MDTTVGVDRVLDDAAFCALVDRLAVAYRVVGPVLRDGAILMESVTSADELVRGVGSLSSPGSCRLVPLADGDDRRFAWSVGPSSAKAEMLPPTERLFSAEVHSDGRFDVVEDDREQRPLAFVGLRPCDVAAASVLGHVIGAPADTPFVVAVDCTEPGATCFCASMGTGPSIDSARHSGVDLALRERSGSAGPEYLATAHSTRGSTLLAEVAPDAPAATGEDTDWAQRSHHEAVAAMGRHLDAGAVPAALLATLESARYAEVADRCLSCGNCTMVCPTCFCSSVHDVSDLDGSRVERHRRWDSCFSLDHSYVHGGSIRSGTAERYRQWLTHKLSTWWTQFGESGCVGCGRCIVWCPVGIDITEEAAALMAEAERAGGDTTGTPVALLTRRRTP